mgnify:CR=1 FL=1
MQKLKIIKASAGSGKTFTLAVEYIKHLVKNPLSYRNILAVTFTNKATLEMKQRVLSQLYGLSRGLKESDSYMAKLKELLLEEHLDTGGKPIDEFIRSRCRTALTEIIHNYHRFRIETIDSFFQSIVRELAHDLDLTANLRVELDNNAALREGVSKVIDSIAIDSDTKKRVFEFVFTKMEDNKNWSVSKEMEKFGQNIFNENFLEYGEELRHKLDHPDFIKDIKLRLNSVVSKSLKDVKQKSQEMLDLCHSNGLGENDFIQKTRGIHAFLEKLANLDDLVKNNVYVSFSKQALKCLEGSEHWSKDSAVVAKVDETGLVSLLKQLEEQVRKSVILTISSRAVLKNLNNLSLINTISKMVQMVTSERNDFLLANTNHFLNQMIEGSDVPFIYERTGSRFDHIMIDEFQDTSGLQWKNFKPLIKNSLDSNEECMLVGDVKQSIYRWRNSEWSILNNISRDPDFASQVMSEPLSTNYRSLSNVVRFNNEFFQNSSSALQSDYSSTINAPSDDIDIAYEGCSQELPLWRTDDKGYIRIELHLPQSSEDSISSDVDIDAPAPCTSMALSDSELWECRRLEWNLKHLLSEGVASKDICILIRTNYHAKIICDYFDHNVLDTDGNAIKIVSSEAYELGNSPSVNIIIWALRVISNPSDRLSLCMLAFHYQTDVKLNTDFSEDLNHLFLMSADEQQRYLPEGFINEMDNLQTVPLYELCEEIYRLFGMSCMEGQDSYLFEFFDYLTDYMEHNLTDIDSFLEYWESTLRQKTVNDGSDDGIRIMTIHKSKGLEFHSVVVPFCSWKINRGGQIWCIGDGETPPFNELPLVPIDVSERMVNSIYSDEVKKEYLKIFVDNLNLIYVAFTRASKNLIIISDDKESGTLSCISGKNGKKPFSDSSELIRHLLPGEATSESISVKMQTIYDVLVKSIPRSMEGQIDYADDLYTFTKGSCIEPSVLEKQESSSNVFKSASLSHRVRFESGKSAAQFRQSNNSERFVNGEDMEQNGSNYQNEGLLFHEILSGVNTESDIDNAIRHLDYEGCFADAWQRENVKRLVKKAFVSPLSKGWFDPHWTVINEHDIVFTTDEVMSDGSIRRHVHRRRPDRIITDGIQTIVIDYKTGRYDEAHEDQVREYIQLLKSMGMPDVHGYLWYIRKEAIYEVRD